MNTPNVAATAASNQQRTEAGRARAAIIVNVRSGSVLDGGAANLRASLDQLRGPAFVSFAAVGPDELEEATAAALDQSPDMIISVGGDGTVRSIAEAASASGTPVAPLPYGTMNVLARHLYGDLTGPEIVARLNDAEVVSVPAGWVNGRLFLLTAAVGFPVSAAKARESMRDGLGHLGDAVLEAAHALADSADMPIMCEGDGFRRRRASGLVLATMPLDKLFGEGESEALDGFEIVATHTHGFVDLVRLGARALADEWRTDESVEVGRSRRVEAHIDGEVIVGLDGDPVRLTNPLVFEFKSQGAPMLVLRET